MKSRIHPKYKTRYRVGNWRAYERALVQRGDVTLWLSADARDAWRPSLSGQPGGQKRFSDLAITTALTLRLVFWLPLRQAEGFLRSVLSLMAVDLETPDHTTLSRRSRHLNVELDRVPSKGPIHLIVDSTGLSIRVGRTVPAASSIPPFLNRSHRRHTGQIPPHGQGVGSTEASSEFTGSGTMLIFGTKTRRRSGRRLSRFGRDDFTERVGSLLFDSNASEQGRGDANNLRTISCRTPGATVL